MKKLIILSVATIIALCSLKITKTYNGVFIPIGTVLINQNVYMDEVEITNMSYREYVSWLKINEEKNYLSALPDTTVWIELTAYNLPYVSYYYQHPAYNEYPVVGVSYEQAVNYCKWRTDRVKEYYVNKKKQTPDFEYRLPTKEEWEMAANVGYSKKTIKQIGTKCKYNVARDVPFEVTANGKTKEELNLHQDVTAPAKSYWQNTLGVYNILGNVKEMIAEKGISKGGSWRTNEKDIAVKTDYSYIKPCSDVGFRCVCVVK